MSQEKPKDAPPEKKEDVVENEEAGEDKAQEEQDVIMGVDEFYDDHHLEKILPDSSLSQRCM